MKLYYIFLFVCLKSDGIQKKVIAQINALNNTGVICHGLFFTNDVQEKTKLHEFIDLIPYPQTNKKYFNILFQKKALLRYAFNYVKTLLRPGELIYLRYPGVTFELYKWTKNFKNRIISEHQAKEIDEIRSSKNEHPFGFTPSKLISFFLYQMWPIFNERVWHNKYSKMLYAKVAVTEEIAIYHKRKCKNVWVIPNGIEVNQYKIRSTPLISDSIRILFLKGTSGLAPWNGIDRLIDSLDKFDQKRYKVELIICGNIIPNEIPERDYLTKMGYLESNDLDLLFSNVHIGFSTLCLYRKKLNEAAVLKAREYFARGLPFVYGYKDPDFKNGDSCNLFTLNVPNDDSLIDFDKVINFVEKIYSDPNHQKKMRQFAEENLDWKVKMNQLKMKLLLKK